MAENLNVDRFRNGDPIPNAVKVKEWKNAVENKQPAWCHYKHDSANGELYGKLYNWYAVIDPRGLAPEGWHIPTVEEWDRLIVNIGGIFTQNTNPWNFPDKRGFDILRNMDGWGTYASKNSEQTNSTGFSGLPAGERGLNGLFDYIVDGTKWWSSTEEVDKWRIINDVWTVSLGFWNLGRYLRQPGMGYSVRCIKD